MTSLAEQQREFLAAIFDAAAPREPAVAIYRRNVLGAAHGALAAAYPVVRRLVGEAFFREAAERFARAVPSERGDLHAFGAAFERFLGQYPHARALPYLPDVARLEWAVHESYHAADGAPFDFAALAAVPAERLGGVRLRLHPAARLVASPHPILALWEANQRDRDGVPDREAGPDFVLVRRVGYSVRPIALAQPDWSMLAALAGGATLDAAWAAMGRQADQSLGPALARHAADGVIGGFALAETA